MNLKYLSIALQVILWLSSIVLAVIWAVYGNKFFEPEPYTVILGLISTAVSVILKKYAEALAEEKFSAANALAYGYVNNFVEPLLTKLIKSALNSSDMPIMYIYIPQKLSELSSKSIDRIKAFFKQKNLIEKTVTIKLEEGRGARDILTIKNINNKNVYFDFPNTLMTLTSLIDFKVSSPKNGFNEEAKNKLEGLYIRAFKATVEKLLGEKNLYPTNIRFTDSSLTFEL